MQNKTKNNLIFSEKVIVLSREKRNFVAMNTLYQHIEHLLLNHDCVVVPHFGGFMAQDQVARYVESEALFFPPVRLVRFNPDLTLGDDLLLRHVCRFYDYSESEGKRAIQSMVHQLRGQLLAEGQVDFGSLGIFSQDEDGEIQFSACQAGATTPSLYGLDAFSIPRLAEQKRPITKVRHSMHPHESDQHQFVTLRVSRRAIRNTLATAAVLLAAVLLAVPVDLVRRHHLQNASLFPSETFAIHGKNSDPNVVERKSIVASQVSDTKNEVSPVPPIEKVVSADSVPTPSESEASAVENNFAIVFASNVSLKNAERYAAELTEKGIGRAHVITSGKNVRVVADGIATETEAYNQVRELKAMGNEFADVWVLRL